ncbi:MAG: AraC family transcriptional regulator [Lachnospiraceae bacterium]|nr:AraC family transcriptional regulator [Lachnospiraceae bacterium]
MKENLMKSLINHILGVPVWDASENGNILEAFETEQCFDKDLQPMFTASALQYLLRVANPGTFYELVDYFDAAILFFIIDQKKYIVGPYAKSAFSDQHMENILIEHGASISKMPALKLYYTNLPILFTDQLQTIINGIIQALVPGSIPYDYRRLTGFISDIPKESATLYSEEKRYSEIYKRYDAEKRFLSMIQNGDVENIISAFKEMAEGSKQDQSIKETQQYYTTGNNIAILRALSRKAAEASGLSVITIDTITQKYAQLSSANLTIEEQNKLLNRMIIELTTAVRNHRLSIGNYSPAIRQTIEYIDLHLSEEITLKILSQNVNLSISRLSTVFKKETGDTIMNYIARQRCKKAANLLKETTFPISEISSFVGYTDNNYFVKVFKKIYHSTPSEYRLKK